MKHPWPGYDRLLPGVVLAFLTLTASFSIALAQMQMDHGSPAAMSRAATFKRGDITVTSPWTRATPGGAKIAGGYFKITNQGTAADRFTGAKADVAERVELHEMSMSDSVMKMRPLPNGIEIKPGETVELKSGGYHLMFMDLKQPLKAGESFKATLQFEKAGPLEVNFAVNTIGGSAPSH